MKNSYITQKEIIFTSIICICSFAFLFSIAPIARNDSWISILLCSLLTLPIILTIYLLLKNNTTNYFDSIESMLGGVLGKVSIILLAFLDIVIMNFSLLNLIDFIQIVLLFYTPIVVTLSCILITVYFLLYKSYKVIVNFGQFIFALTILFLMLSFMFITKHMNFNELLPIAHNNSKNILIGIIQVFSSTFCIIIFIPCLFKNTKNIHNISKPFLVSLTISTLIILILFIKNLTVLGATEQSKFYFPKHELHRVIGLGTLFQRTEILLSSLFILTEILKIGVYIFFLLEALKHLLHTSNYKLLLVPTLLMVGNNMLAQYESIVTISDKKNLYFQTAICILIYAFSLLVLFSYTIKKLFKIFNR